MILEYWSFEVEKESKETDKKYKKLIKYIEELKSKGGE